MEKTVQGHLLALEGQPGRCPFRMGAGMDAKTLELSLLATLALLGAIVAYAVDDFFFGTVFTTFSAAAVLGAALTWAS